MRVLLIGDIHTEDDLLVEALALGVKEGVDRVLSVGDIVDGPNDPLPCITRLRQRRVDVVRGNHERWVIEGNPMDLVDYSDDVMDWLAELPSTREYTTPTGRLLLCHGIGDDDMAELDYDTFGYGLENLDPLWALVRAKRYRYVVGGHTHKPMVREIEGIVFINPGTLVATQQPGATIADFTTRVFERYVLSPTVHRSQTWRLDNPPI
ncbi:MAG: metallophosphoesterase family protein [Kofleriaceae bacterium]